MQRNMARPEERLDDNAVQQRLVLQTTCATKAARAAETIELRRSKGRKPAGRDHNDCGAEW